MKHGVAIAPIHAGIKYDLEQLLLKFKEAGSGRFRDFATAFRSLEMHRIFYGRQSCGELVEFSERLLQIAASYMLPSNQVRTNGINTMSLTQYTMADHYSIERIFGIYACYALYYLQPADYVVQIRITAGQMDHVTDLIRSFLLPDRHYDTLAVLYKLIDDGAFKIVAYETCFDPVCHKRFDLPDMDESCVDDSEPPFSLAKTIVNEPILKQIEIVHKQYVAGKTQMAFGNKLSHHPRKILSGIYKEYKHKYEKELVEDEMEEEASVMGVANTDKNTVMKSNIKEKAYSSKIQHSRNRRYADPSMEANFTDTPGTSKGSRLKSKSKSPKKSLGGPTTDLMDRTIDSIINDLCEPEKKSRRKNKDGQSTSRNKKQVIIVPEEDEAAKSKKVETGEIPPTPSTKTSKRKPKPPPLDPEFEANLVRMMADPDNITETDLSSLIAE